MSYTYYIYSKFLDSQILSPIHNNDRGPFSPSPSLLLSLSPPPQDGDEDEEEEGKVLILG